MSAGDLNTPLVLPKYVRAQRFFSITGTAALGVYIVLKADFGDKPHCFTPLREWVQEKQDRFWKPSTQEVQRLQQIESKLQLDKTKQ